MGSCLDFVFVILRQFFVLLIFLFDLFFQAFVHNVPRLFIKAFIGRLIFFYGTFVFFQDFHSLHIQSLYHSFSLLKIMCSGILTVQKNKKIKIYIVFYTSILYTLKNHS